MKTNQLTLGQGLKGFVQKSPARMAFIIAALIYIITIVVTPSALNMGAIGSIIMLTLLLSFASAGQTIVLIGGGGWLGYWLDGKYGTLPLWSVLCSVAGQQK